MFGNFGMGELIVIFLVILVLFGSKKIPDLAQGVGKGMKEFRKAIKDVEDEVSSSMKSESVDKEGKKQADKEEKKQADK
jgi:sec-independent protein translocase protein TatA